MPNNRIGLEISYRGEKHQFYPEQIVAMVLQKMKHIVRRQNINPSDMVISCPSYFTEQERKALLDACAIANVNCLKLMNEHVATSLAYGLFRRSEFSNEPRHVAFVDFGHSSTSAYVVAFTKEKMTVLAQGHERNMGTRNLDYKLFEFYCNWFQEQNGVNPAKSDKARLRLFDALEKQRKVLSANGDATLNIEYLIEDYDLNHTLSREQYEELIKPQLERFRDCLKSCLSQLSEEILVKQLLKTFC
jgi:heat shock protein 4